MNIIPLWQVFGAISILLGISIAVIYAIKKAPFLFVGWFWYLGVLIPVIGLMQVGRQAMADRYTYLPSIGIAIMIAWGAAYLLPKEERKRKIILLPTVSAVLIILTILTWRQCGYWKNSSSLFNHDLQITKNNYLAHSALGAALAAEGKKNEAIVIILPQLRLIPITTTPIVILVSPWQSKERMKKPSRIILRRSILIPTRKKPIPI